MTDDMTKNKSYKKRKSHKKRKSDLKKAREAAAVFSVLLLAIALCAVFWGGNKDKTPTDAESDISALTEAQKETEKSATEALASALATNGTTKKELNTEKERPVSSEAAIKSESTTKKPPVLTTKPAETEAVKINLKTEHGGFSNGKTLTRAQQQAIIDYENAYFSSLSNLKTAIPNGLFANKSVKNLEKAIWDSTVAIRKSALEDLSLTGYTFSLRVKKITAESKGVRVTLIEQNTQQFKSLSVLSEQFDVEHIFLLTKSENGSWLISEHECDAGAFYNFSYDSSLGKDAQLDSLLSKAKARQNTRASSKMPKAPECDVPYNRDAAVKYMMKWVGKRNSSWADYSPYGGNCMNLASQVLYTAGIPMDSVWYYKNGTASPAWCNVNKFYSYASSGKGKLVCSTSANYYAGEPGDLITMGTSSYTRHITEICALVTDENGSTVDYLLCSNTADLKNFPAGAYYFTNQKLIKIYGSNK